MCICVISLHSSIKKNTKNVIKNYNCFVKNVYKNKMYTFL